jgi:tRNA-specific 2-thiouridylase
MRNKVIVAMSGGVDSSVTASIMQKAGFDVIGATLQLHEYCSKAIEDAKVVANYLGIEHFVIDAREKFKEKIIDLFVDYYSNGLTPNPCVFCNRDIKSDILLNFAEKLKADFVATGHYAMLKLSETGEVLLEEAIDKTKDQSYFLSLTQKEKFKKIKFPLGTLTKKEVRQIAAQVGLPVATKAESQDICFIPNDDYKKFLKESKMISEEKRGKLFKTGDITLSGEKVGTHDGIALYTIGQRRGLGISYQEPLYIVDINPEDSQILVAKKEQLMIKKLSMKDTNWLIEKELPFDCEIKLRSGIQKLKATAEKISSTETQITINDDLTKLFKTPISRGQICVLYEGNCIIGGGIII